MLLRTPSGSGRFQTLFVSRSSRSVSRRMADHGNSTRSNRSKAVSHSLQFAVCLPSIPVTSPCCAACMARIAKPHAPGRAQPCLYHCPRGKGEVFRGRKAPSIGQQFCLRLPRNRNYQSVRAADALQRAYQPGLRSGQASAKVSIDG